MCDALPKNQKYYSEIAQKFGNLVRNNLIHRGKKYKQQSVKIFQLLQSFSSSCQHTQNNSRRLSEIPTIYTATARRKDKFCLTQQFKQKLKYHLTQNRIHQQQRIHQLANTIRWRRMNTLATKQNKIHHMEHVKKQQANLMRYLLGKSKDELSRNKRQIQLEHSFKRLERRLKNQTPEKQIKCN